jgi:predicted ATPase
MDGGRFRGVAATAESSEPAIAFEVEREQRTLGECGFWRVHPMRLLGLRAQRYRSLREQTIRLGDLNVFIGTNASGKSTILDALRFLHEGVQARDFKEPVGARGGIIHLAWKGEDARQVDVRVELSEEGRTYHWSVRLTREGYEFSVREEVFELPAGTPPVRLLLAESGTGWWWSGEGRQVPLRQTPTTCALAAASADATFPARRIAEFVGGWGFFDPSPFSLRRDWPGAESGRLDAYGRNLAKRLYALSKSSPDTFRTIVTATQSVLGLPTEIEPRESEGRYYFAQTEPGLEYPVHQIGTSSGTLRMLALMTALFEGAADSLVGIEEPENHVHPTALAAFAEHLVKARDRVQILVTTHSPLLLDFLNDPSAVAVVRRYDQEGTRVTREENLEGVRKALDASGFGLGEFYETLGFGG